MEQCLPQQRSLLGERVYVGVLGGPPLSGGRGAGPLPTAAQCGLRGALGKYHPGLFMRPERNGPLRLPDPQRTALTFDARSQWHHLQKGCKTRSPAPPQACVQAGLPSKEGAARWPQSSGPPSSAGRTASPGGLPSLSGSRHSLVGAGGPLVQPPSLSGPRVL